MLWKHRGMLLRPRYGLIGLVVLPYYWAFELLGPVVELLGLPVVAIALSLGILGLHYAFLFALASLGYALFLSVCALSLEELTFRRYPRWQDLGWALLAAVVENCGYRQLHAWWRLKGLWAALRGRAGSWGAMPRMGFGALEPRPQS